MKKFLFAIMLMVSAIALTSCESCSNDDAAVAGFTYSLDVAAKGDGMLVVSYPTGKMDLNGAASFEATSSNDTTLMVNVPNDCPNFRAVLANPENYSEEQVKLANEVGSAFNVDTMSGNWNVDITGYAKYSNIYIVIDEHWPKADTVAMVETAVLEEETLVKE